MLRHICFDICLAVRKNEHVGFGLWYYIVSSLAFSELQAIQLTGRRHRPHEEPQSYERHL